MLSRRRFVGQVGAAALLSPLSGFPPSAARADEASDARKKYIGEAKKSLVFAGSGGALGEVFKNIFVDFTNETGISVNYLTGPILDMYGRVRAERNRPSIDVFLSNGVAEAKGVDDGAFQPLDPHIVTSLPDLYDLARVSGDMGVRIEFTDIGILFNKKALQDNKIPPIKTWGDIWSPALSGRVIIGDTTSFYTVLYIAYMNKLRGGREDDPTAGIDFIASQKSKLMAIVRTYPERMQMLNSGQAWLTVDVGLTSIPETIRNPDLDFVAPQEGTPLFWNGFNVVKNCPNPIGAQLLVQHMISPQAQEKFARGSFVGPVNKTVRLPEDLAKRVPYGPEAVSRRVALNNGLIGESMGRYRDLWNAKIASN